MLFRRILSRDPDPKEKSVLRDRFDTMLRYYSSQDDDALRLLNFGQFEQRGGKDPDLLAAYMVIASMIYNLDEAMTHE